MRILINIPDGGKANIAGSDLEVTINSSEVYDELMQFLENNVDHTKTIYKTL